MIKGYGYALLSDGSEFNFEGESIQPLVDAIDDTSNFVESIGDGDSSDCFLVVGETFGELELCDTVSVLDFCLGEK